MRKTALFASLGAALIVPAMALAHDNDVPPSNAKLLSEILATADSLGLGQIVEAEFDDGRWDIILCEQATCYKVEFDPISGQELRRKSADSKRLPPASAAPLTTVITQVEVANPGVITAADYDDGYWSVELVIQP